MNAARCPGGPVERWGERAGALARRRRAFGRLAAGAGAGALGLLSAGAIAARAEGVVGDELRLVDGETFYGLDPVHELTTSYLRGAGAAETLLRVSPYGDVEVELARAFEPIDPETWRVFLRPEATFWSGRAVDARVVVESIDRHRALSARSATILRGLRFEAEGDWTLVVRGEGPIPGLPLVLADDQMVVHNPASYGPQDNSFDVGAADLTGYYRITSFVPRNLATLERNERYWGVRPRMARVRLQEINDPEARALVALSGEAHLVRSPSTGAAKQFERSRVARLTTTATASTAHTYLNTQKPPFDDVRVRQAMAWAVDREELVALAVDGLGRGLPTWLSSNPAYPEARRTGYVRYDAVKAGQLLDEAGWRFPSGGRVRQKDGKPLTFRLVWWGTGRSIAEVLQNQWAKVGAQVEVEGSADYGFLVARRAENNWEAFTEMQGTFGDPAPIVARHMAPDGVNFYHKLQDPEVDRLMAGFATLSDAEERRQQALKVNARHAEIMPFIPLIARDRLVAISRDLHNFTPHFLGTAYDLNPDLWVSA